MLDAGIYEQLSRLVIAMKQKSSQNMAGNRRSVQKGTSAEFSDFREYMPGDDLRRLDWNVYARSERMYIREYFEEKEAVVSVILDTSASMHYGKKSKAELAQDLCAVIAFLTLHHMDRLVLYDSSQMGTPLVVSGGKNALPKVLGWLQARTFSGTETDSFSAVRQMQRRGAGVTVIVSDFLTEAATDPTQDRLEKTMQYLDFTKQRHVYPGIFRRKGSSGIGYFRYQCINALWKKEQGRTGTGSVRGDCLSDFAPYGPAGAV